MSELIRRYGTGLTGFMVLPSAIWILGMVILPDLLMVELSFKPNLLPSEIGTEKDIYTLANYATLWRHEVHFAILRRRSGASALITILSLCVCYPVTTGIRSRRRPGVFIGEW